MSFDNEIQVLRTISQKSFEDEMLSDYGMTADHLTAYRKTKNLTFRNNVLVTPYYCREHEKLGYVPATTSNLHSSNSFVDNVQTLIDEYQHILPPLEIALLNEKLWHLDKSRVANIIDALEGYVEAAGHYEHSENQDQFIKTRVECLTRSLSTGIKLETEFSKNPNKNGKRLKQVQNANEAIRNLFNEYLGCQHICLAIHIRTVESVIRLGIHDNCPLFEPAVEQLLKTKLDIENDLFFIRSLFPALLSIGRLDIDWYVDRVYKFALSVIDTSPSIANQRLRDLLKFCNDNGFQPHNDLQDAINTATSRSKSELLRKENIVGSLAMTIKAPILDLTGKTTVDMVEYFCNLNLPTISETDARICADDFTLGQIATHNVYDSENRIRNNNLSNDNSEDVNAYSSPYVMVTLVQRSAIIEAALNAINQSDAGDRESLRKACVGLFPSEFALSLADGLYSLMRLEYHIALPVLIPRFESILKYALIESGESITTTRSDTFDTAKGLDSLIELAGHHSLINDQEVYMSRLLLTDAAAGNIVRHEISHGSLADDNMNSPACLNAAQFIFRLAKKLSVPSS